MRTKTWWLILALAMVLVILILAMVIIPPMRDCQVHPVSAQDEKVAAERLLAQQLSGPRYFNAPAGSLPDDGEIWIDAGEAIKQVPRIVAERKLRPELAKVVMLLVEKLSVPHPYRVVGGDRVNLLRLNLSLDSIK